MKWTIYYHIHTESGRRYVGLTKLTMMQRWNRHVYSANYKKDGKFHITSHFPNAIRKYGKEAFAHEILEICLTLESANAAEEKWIKFYDTTNPKKGFNSIKGGKHVFNQSKKNPWDRPEYREKCSIASKANWNNLTYRMKITTAMIGKTLSPDAKAKISISAKRPMSLEVRTKLSATLNTPESVIKRSIISKAVRARPEVIAKMSAALRNRVFSTATKAKLRAIRLARTHCKNGHSFDDAYISGIDGRRICRTCSKLRGIKYRNKLNV